MGRLRACLAVLVGLMLGQVASQMAGMTPGAMAQNGGSAAMLDTLFAKLQAATDPMAIQALEAAIWEQWTLAPEGLQRELMDRGIAEMQQRQFRQSVDTFTRLIALAPDLSEAWNKRATAYWLLGDFKASLSDICETVKREPRHFGAYSGLGMIHAERGEYARAVAAFELARRYNPHIPGIVDEIDRMKALGGDRPADPLGCDQRTAGR